MLHRRNISIIIFERIEGMRISRDNSLHTRSENCFRIFIPQILKQHLFTESPDLVAAVFFVLPENTEILIGCLQDSGAGSADILHPVIIGGNAVDKIKRLGGFFFPEDPDL